MANRKLVESSRVRQLSPQPLLESCGGLEALDLLDCLIFYICIYIYNINNNIFFFIILIDEQVFRSLAPKMANHFYSVVM